MFRVVCTIVMLWFVSPSVEAEPLGQTFDSSAKERRAEKEAEIAAAEAEEEANKSDYARVIVLRLPVVSTDHTDINLQRNVFRHWEIRCLFFTSDRPVPRWQRSQRYNFGSRDAARKSL